jgi:hypothetical protein
MWGLSVSVARSCTVLLYVITVSHYYASLMYLTSVPHMCPRPLMYTTTASTIPLPRVTLPPRAPPTSSCTSCLLAYPLPRVPCRLMSPASLCTPCLLVCPASSCDLPRVPYLLVSLASCDLPRVATAFSCAPCLLVYLPPRVPPASLCITCLLALLSCVALNVILLYLLRW